MTQLPFSNGAKVNFRFSKIVDNPYGHDHVSVDAWVANGGKVNITNVTFKGVVIPENGIDLQRYESSIGRYERIWMYEGVYGNNVHFDANNPGILKFKATTWKNGKEASKYYQIRVSK